MSAALTKLTEAQKHAMAIRPKVGGFPYDFFASLPLVGAGEAGGRGARARCS